MVDRFCSTCGRARAEGDRFCPGCGRAYVGADPDPPDKIESHSQFARWKLPGRALFAAVIAAVILAVALFGGRSATSPTQASAGFDPLGALNLLLNSATPTATNTPTSTPTSTPTATNTPTPRPGTTLHFGPSNGLYRCQVYSPSFNMRVNVLSANVDALDACVAFADELRHALPQAVAQKAASDKALCGLASLLDPTASLICRFVGNPNATITVTVSPGGSDTNTLVCSGTYLEASWDVRDTGRKILGQAACSVLGN